MGLDIGEVPGNSLGLLYCGVVLYSGSVGHSTTDDFSVHFSGTEQAISPRGRGEPGKGELLGSELPFYGGEMALLLEFTVDLDAKKPGFLD